MKVAVEEWELYNNGILLCKWFDTEADAQEEVAEYVAQAKTAYKLNSNDLEMFIADVEDDATGLIKGDESLCYAYEVTQKIIELEENERAALKLMLQNGVVSDLDEAIEHLDDMICTGERKMEDVAYNYVHDVGLLASLEERLHGYFDYEALGRDMELEGSYFEDEEGILWEYVS
ncbi:MAG: hypothetical protein QG617_318 [Campylobacterota bacterium]|nr:hypothetical protein [Campylobacterota bacterium]